jgi:hypothetical protein
MKTAEKFLNKKKYPSFNENGGLGIHYVKEAMIEFAKMHVQEALKQVSEKAFVEYIDLNTDEIFDYTDVIADDDVGVNVNKDSILNAYSLENIK